MFHENVGASLVGVRVDKMVCWEAGTHKGCPYVNENITGEIVI